jgi:hypothetical protein
MRRYKLLVVHILLILSVFNFVQVLAAPVPVREVREARADMEDGGEDVIIVHGKRADEGQDPLTGHYGLTQASSDPPGQSSTSSQDPSGSPPTSDHASGVHQETINPIQLPSPASGGTALPWYSKSSGGGEVQPGTSVGTNMGKWVPGTSVRTKTNNWVATTEIEPGSSSSGQITPASSNKGLPLSEQTASSSDLLGPVSEPDQSSALSHDPSGSPSTSDHASGIHQETPNKLPSPSSVRVKTYPWVATTEIETASSSSGETTPVSSPSKVFSPPELEGYLAQTPTKQPKPQSNSFWGKLASKSKSLFGQLVSKSKSLFGQLVRISKGWVSEMVANPKLQLRSSAAVSGAVNAAQRELQGTVHTEACVSTYFLSHKHSDLMVFLSVIF